MLTDDYLPHITYHLFSANLKVINFYKCNQVTDHLLYQLSQSGCMLKHLTVHECNNVSDEGIKYITIDQEELEVLELRKLRFLTSYGLEVVRSNKLQKLDLKGCSYIDSKGLDSLVHKCPNIKYLTLSQCTRLDEGISNIARCLNITLEELDVGGVHKIGDHDLENIAQYCSNLTLLHLIGCYKITVDGIQKVVEGCRKLKDVDFSYCFTLESVEAFKALQHLPDSVTELSLLGIQLQDSELLVNVVKRLTKLETVRLCGVKALDDDSLEQILQAAGSHLLSLDIGGSITQAITDDGLRAVTKYCTALEELILTLLPETTGITLLPLFEDEQRAAQLTSLYLGCKKMNGDVLHAAAVSSTNLEKFSVSGLMCVDDNLLHTLADNCPKLHYIGLKSCRQVTDSGVCELARKCPLRRVVLAGCHHLTDKSIFTLANMCLDIQELHLNGCAHVSPVAVRYLQDQCTSRVYIQHKIPNAAPNQLMAKNLDTGEFCRADLIYT
ncbi:F-box/LRR-repeat protein 2 isoform X2 [Lingula anatina]|nr:F-box/LRR-repeat protein 2 isoform X2 [Lingula anatina]|eukprot:XP_013397166.1 F-box/LRR-repeat protein 2 isoform X2 [Lingula anatina]